MSPIEPREPSPEPANPAAEYMLPPQEPPSPMVLLDWEADAQNQKAEQIAREKRSRKLILDVRQVRLSPHQVLTKCGRRSGQ
jgi:hypothetical protein